MKVTSTAVPALSMTPMGSDAAKIIAIGLGTAHARVCEYTPHTWNIHDASPTRNPAHFGKGQRRGDPALIPTHVWGTHDGPMILLALNPRTQCTQLRTRDEGDLQQGMQTKLAADVCLALTIQF